MSFLYQVQAKRQRMSVTRLHRQITNLLPPGTPQRSSELTHLLLRKRTQGVKRENCAILPGKGEFNDFLLSMAEGAEMPRIRPASSIYAVLRRQGYASPSRKTRLALDPAPPHHSVGARQRWVSFASEGGSTFVSISGSVFVSVEGDWATSPRK